MNACPTVKRVRDTPAQGPWEALFGVYLRVWYIGRHIDQGVPQGVHRRHIYQGVPQGVYHGGIPRCVPQGVYHGGIPRVYGRYTRVVYTSLRREASSGPLFPFHCWARKGASGQEEGYLPTMLGTSHHAR